MWLKFSNRNRWIKNKENRKKKQIYKDNNKKKKKSDLAMADQSPCFSYVLLAADVFCMGHVTCYLQLNKCINGRRIITRKSCLY